MKNLILLLTSLTMALAAEVDVQEFISNNNLFTGAVYDELVKTNDKDFLVSPFSVQTVLALTQSGAKGATAEEIRTSLRLPNSTEKTESLFKTLLPTLKKKSDSPLVPILPTFKSNSYYSLHTANKIYVKENFTLNEGFKKVATEVYQADLENINFSEKSVAVKAMNDWVEKQTQNKIHDLISSGDLKNKTKVILINALYFKGNWANPFDRFRTEKTNFYKTSKDVFQVDTMHKYEAQYNYYESTELNAKFLEMPFEGFDAFMTIVLPNEKEGLASLEKQIDKVFTDPKYSRENVNVDLPRFKIETEIDFDNILKNMGVHKAFREDEADLSGIAGEKGDLLIDKVKQKTFVDVNEDGVEAAAATFVSVGSAFGSTVREHREPKTFIADHPFIFYIKVKDLIIFGGRVLAPNQ